MKIRYFAWVRERIGRDGEELEPPAEVVTVADLLTWLRGRGEEYEYALERPEVIRVALDQRHAAAGTALGAAREVALFPPMTGG
ncbi:molybdopterin converting factor subunit 1 [Siculibacillus lacustris]|uniref:Molybdopterin converting factor subunit 1 n=1 Tax=Siculibacillus lacustris TaxID=1549641 RepID=A0A4Q9VHT5_9HYPH|nr:molybdopterin converting factor subunit 1 [Siculibacillus lacustris]TBW34727.1 molybdopterin converting factor subunit 1 [Siculibacillus lacustris]